MSWPEDFTQKEVDELSAAIDTLLASEQFGNWCENANYHHMDEILDDFKDDLCVHDWGERAVDRDYGDAIEYVRICRKCEADQYIYVENQL